MERKRWSVVFTFGEAPEGPNGPEIRLIEATYETEPLGEAIDGEGGEIQVEQRYLPLVGEDRTFARYAAYRRAGLPADEAFSLLDRRGQGFN